MAYVYRHIRLDKNVPFYVGIGSDDNGKYTRAHNSGYTRNKHWHNIVNKVEYEVEIIIDSITWEECLLKETEFIKLYGRQQFGGTLVNLTDGGEGNVGYITSEESKKKQSLKKIGKSPSNKGKPMPKDQLENLIKINKGRPAWNKGISPKKESVEKYKESMKGKRKIGVTHHQFGKPMPDHVKESLKIANKNRIVWNKGVKLSEDQKIKGGYYSGINNKKVLKFDYNHNLIAEYESATIAAKIHGVTKGFMCMASKSNKTQICKGFYWDYKKI